MKLYEAPTTRGAPPKLRRQVDHSLSILLGLQALTLFIAIPVGSFVSAGHILLDVCHVAFAIVCIATLTQHRGVQAGLVVLVFLLAIGPNLSATIFMGAGLDSDFALDIIPLTAFAFNAAITALVARHVFASGRVTAYRVQGTVLLYLNVAALFGIAYSVMASALPGAIAMAGGASLPGAPGARTAALTYFSITTITTAGYGDIIPVHPLARSLANFEALFGQLFPPIFVARMVALHLAHDPDVAVAPVSQPAEQPEGAAT